MSPSLSCEEFSRSGEASSTFYYNGPAGQLFPERYEMFLARWAVAPLLVDTISAYHDLLFDRDPAAWAGRRGLEHLGGCHHHPRTG